MSTPNCCLDCVGREKVDTKSEVVLRLKEQFKEFENADGRNWGQVDLATKQFKRLILETHEAGIHPEVVFSPSNMCEVLTSLLVSSIVKESYMSEVFATVYHCVRLSKTYHLSLYKERRFWCVIFEHILSFPDVQFFEAVMIFIMVIVQVFDRKSSRLSCSNYQVSVENYLYVTGHFHPEKFYPIFKKLFEIQLKKISSKDTAFTVDYRNCVSPLYAPSVAEKEWYALEMNQPVEFMSIMVHMYLTRPVIVDLLFLKASGIQLLMAVFRNKSCKHMHASIMFCLDAMFAIENDFKYSLFIHLLETLDFPLIVKIAVDDDLHYLRALAQKVILHTLNFLEIGKKTGLLFSRPRKKDLLQVRFSKLKDMISYGGMDDKVFALVVVKERVDDEREEIMKENFQDFAACILDTCEEKLDKCKPNLRTQLITVSLNFLTNLGPLSEWKHPDLMTIYNIKNTLKFFDDEDEDIRLLSRACAVNLCHLNFAKRVDLFQQWSLETLANEMYALYCKHKNKNVDEEPYLQIMPLDMKLLHNLLQVHYRIKTVSVQDKRSGREILDMFKPGRPRGSKVVCVTGEKWHRMMDDSKLEDIDVTSTIISTDVCNKLMEVVVSVMFDSRMPDLVHLSGVSCIAHILHDDKNDISKFLTDKVIKFCLDQYDKDLLSRDFYLSEGGDFRSIYTNTFLSRVKITEEEPADDRTPPHKICANPACPNKDHVVKKKFKKCGKCRMATYCGRDCQIDHWKDHRTTCTEKT